MSVACEVKQLVERLLQLTDGGLVVDSDGDEDPMIHAVRTLQVKVDVLGQQVLVNALKIQQVDQQKQGGAESGGEEMSERTHGATAGTESVLQQHTERMVQQLERMHVAFNESAQQQQQQHQQRSERMVQQIERMHVAFAESAQQQHQQHTERMAQQIERMHVAFNESAQQHQQHTERMAQQQQQQQVPLPLPIPLPVHVEETKLQRLQWAVEHAEQGSFNCYQATCIGGNGLTSSLTTSTALVRSVLDASMRDEDFFIPTY
jgi:hypothetical protein